MRQSRLFVVLLCCLGWFSPGLHGESVKTIGPPTNYVTDLAGVLNASTESDLDALLKSVHDQANAQVFVVTVHKIDDDEPIDQFANELFQKWKIGNAKTDKGALLVLSVDDHKYRIEVGYGLEGILPDGKTGDIGRDMVPDLQSGNYDGAVRTGVNEIADVIAQDAGVTLQTKQPVRRQRRQSQESGGGFGLFGILFIGFILWMLFRGGRGGRGGGGYGGGGGGFLSGLLLGNLLGGGRSWGGGRGSWDDSGGGGWGGGDSGGSWGGGDGGGSFGGGDGGSSGGGGASGGW